MNTIIIFLLLCPFAAFGWVQKVSEEGNLFGFIRKFNLPEFIKKPLYKCTGCVGGQMALWVYVIISVDAIPQIVWTIYVGILCILAAIGLALIIEIKALK